MIAVVCVFAYYYCCCCYCNQGFSLRYCHSHYCQSGQQCVWRGACGCEYQLLRVHAVGITMKYGFVGSTCRVLGYFCVCVYDKRVCVVPFTAVIAYCTVPQSGVSVWTSQLLQFTNRGLVFMCVYAEARDVNCSEIKALILEITITQAPIIKIKGIGHTCTIYSTSLHLCGIFVCVCVVVSKCLQ